MAAGGRRCGHGEKGAMFRLLLGISDIAPVHSANGNGEGDEGDKKRRPMECG